MNKIEIGEKGQWTIVTGQEYDDYHCGYIDITDEAMTVEDKLEMLRKVVNSLSGLQPKRK